MNKKPKILIVNLPFSGHTNPTLGLAKKLTDLGCSVSYIHAPEWQKKIQETGAAFIPYEDYPSTLSSTEKKHKCWSAAYQTVKKIGAAYDCLVYETLFLPGKALADELGIPAFRLFSTFALNQNILLDFGYHGGWYLTKIFRFPFFHQLVSAILRTRLPFKYPTIMEEISKNQPVMNFIYTIEEFQLYSHEFPPAQYQYVGPAIEDRNEMLFDFPQFTPPIIYISLGTLLNTSVRFFKHAIKAFEKQDVSVIISIGQTIKKEQLGKIPENVYVYSFVPQLKVLEKAALFITHGGMNSVNEALYFATPMLVVPVGNDQPTIANQVEKLGLGKKLAKNKISSTNLWQSANDILRDEEIQKNLKTFQALSQKAGGNQKIAEVIISKLKKI